MKSHIIPKFILRRFTENPKNKGSLLFLYRKDLKEIKKRHPNNCFWEENHFITPTLDENDGNKNSKEVESKLSAVESQMAKITCEINRSIAIHHRTTIPLEPIKITTIKRYLLSSSLRSRYSDRYMKMRTINETIPLREMLHQAELDGFHTPLIEMTNNLVSREDFNELLTRGVRTQMNDPD